VDISIVSYKNSFPSQIIAYAVWLCLVVVAPPSLDSFASKGKEPGYHSANDARAHGVTVASIHAAANGFPQWNSGGYRLDLDHLLHRPLVSVNACLAPAMQVGLPAVTLLAMIAVIFWIRPAAMSTGCRMEWE
jgi:hypothetical protein